MKLIVSFLLAFGLLVAALPPCTASPATGIFVQEYWAGARPGYWIGNGQTSPVSVQIEAGGGQGSRIGPLTIAPGCANDVDAAPVASASLVQVRVGDNQLAGTMNPVPQTPPVPAAAQNVVLQAALGGGTTLHNVWVEIESLPTIQDRTLRVTMRVNGALGGFVKFRSGGGRVFSPDKITSVTSTGFPVRRATNGDWYVDTRKAQPHPLQSIMVDLSLTPSKSPTLVVLDASLVDEKRLLMPLSRAIYIGPAHAGFPKRN